MEGPLFYYHWNAGEVKKESWQHNKQAFDEHSFQILFKNASHWATYTVLLTGN